MIKVENVKIYLAITLLFLPVILSGAPVEISATIDRTTIALNQTFVYTIEISGEKANSTGNPELPDISAFTNYLGSSGTSQNIQIVNGKMTVSKSMSFSFMATKPGQFTIPPSQINFEGKVYKTKPIEIEITKQATGKPQSGTTRRQPDRKSVV